MNTMNPNPSNIANQIVHNNSRLTASTLYDRHSYHSDRVKYSNTFAEPEADAIQQDFDDEQKAEEDVKPKRKNGATRYPESVLVILKAWWKDNVQKPNPTSQQIDELAQSCGLSRTQVNNWYTNQRKRDPERRKRTEAQKRELILSSNYSGQFDYLAEIRRKRLKRSGFYPPTPPVFNTSAYDRHLPLVTPTTSSQLPLLDARVGLVDLSFFCGNTTRDSPIDVDLPNTMEAILNCKKVVDDASVIDDPSLMDIDPSLMDIDLDMNAEFEDNCEEWSTEKILLEAEFLMKHDCEYGAINEDDLSLVTNTAQSQLLSYQIVLADWLRATTRDSSSVVNVEMDSFLEDDEDEQWSTDIFRLEDEFVRKLEYENATIQRINEERRLYEAKFACDADLDYIETPTSLAELDSFKIRLRIADKWLAGGDGDEFGLISSFYSHNI
jgi:Homeobox KN domain